MRIDEMFMAMMAKWPLDTHLLEFPIMGCKLRCLTATL